MITIDNLPKILFDATLLLILWIMLRIALLLIEPPKKLPPDKIKEILRILSK